MNTRYKKPYEVDVLFSLFLVLFLWGVISSCAPELVGPKLPKPSSLEKTSVPFLDQYGGLAVEAILNEQVTAQFMVDSGSTITIISRSTAKKLGIDLEKTLPSIGLRTLSETIYAPLVVLNSINVGGMHVRNFTVAVYDRPFPGQPGLLGLNFLRHFRFTFDMKKRALLLEKK